MLVLSLPMCTFLVLGFLFLRRWVTERRLDPLAWLLALCALQSLIISLAQHYQVPGMQAAQPITATLIPPTAWVTFLTTAIRRPRWHDLVYFAGTVCAIISMIGVPMLVDVLIPVLFVGYGAAILLHTLRGGPDALLQLRLETGELPARIWVVISISLMASAIGDIFISLAYSVDKSWLKSFVISGFSAANLMVIGGLSLTGVLRSDPVDGPDTPPDADAMDHSAMEKLQHLMDTERPYLNPNLTLMKLARKIGVPAKSLSAAINRTTGQNVSRYVNDARIKAARDLLEQGEAVTAAMLSPGFNTKSNFNREFRRVTGMSPSDWLRHPDRLSTLKNPSTGVK